MKLKDFLTPTIVYRTALGVSFLVVISVALVFHMQMDSLNASVKQISDSNRKQTELERLVSSISIKENNLRNYIITKDSTNFENDSLVNQNIYNSISEIKSLNTETSDPKEIQGLDKMIQAHFKIFDETYEISHSEEIDMGLLKKKLLESSKITSDIREEVYKIRDKEVSNLKIHNINHRYNVEKSAITAFSLTIIVLVILLFSLHKVNFDYRKLQHLNRNLRFSNQISDNAEKVAGISHWKINMVSGKYFYSDNFYIIFGL